MVFGQTTFVPLTPYVREEMNIVEEPHVKTRCMWRCHGQANTAVHDLEGAGVL